MKKIYHSLLLLSSVVLTCSIPSHAQLTGGNVYLPGRWLEVGIAPNGSWGPATAPASYYPYSGWSNLASVYDVGHDGWTAGTPAETGDYTYPGTPFEGWSIQVNGTRYDAFYTTGASVGTSFTAGLTGSNTSYTNSAGRLTGVWQGTCGGLQITQTTRVDTNASWAIVTTVFNNPTGAAIPGVYYWRTCDPDNDETYSGNFATNNYIAYQNDADHRVLAASTGTVYSGSGGATSADAYMALGTKDCRAKAMIYELWSPYPATGAANSLDKIYNGTATNLGATYYGLGQQTLNQDIAIGLIYNVGTVPAGGSAVISYAYIYGDASTAGNAAIPLTTMYASIDSAFPEPTLVVNGTAISPSGPAPAPTYDTFHACGSGLTTLPVNIINANDKCWTWSTWTWSPGTGLSSTTGVTNTINLTSLPPVITYTITGVDSNMDMYSCNMRTMYLTILTCNGATVNVPCLGDALYFNAPGDSTGATYSWYGPSPSTTVIATTQSFTITPSVWADTGTYHVIKTVAGVPDTSSVHVVINPIPTITPPLSLCPTGTTTLTATPPGGTWVSSNSGVASVGSSSGVVTGGSLGNAVITYTSLSGCIATTTITVINLSPISGVTTLCQGQTTTLSNMAPGGTWSSGNPSVATIGLTNGIVTGLTGGIAPITYAIVGGCSATTTVTVNPNLPITGPTSECQRWTSITLSDPVGGGTWTSSNVSIATVTPTTGTVYGVTPGYGGNVTITYVNIYGCVETYTVTINPTPVKPAETPFTVCQFTPMAPLGPPQVTTVGPAYLWYGPGVTAGSATPPTPQSSLPGTDSFYVTYTSPFGCVSDSSLMMVYITAKPDTPTTFAAQYCQFYQKPATVDSQVSNYTGTLKWYIGGVLQGTAPEPQDSAFTYPGYEVFYVTQTVNGCESDSAMVPVRIVPSPQFTIAHPDWVCQDDSAMLSYSGYPGSPLIDSAYLWSLPPGATFANGTTATDSAVMVEFDSSITNNYVTLIVSNLYGECTDTISIRQNVIALPSATATSKADVCPSDTVTIALSTASPSATDFTWYVDNSPLASSNALSILSANSNSGGPYTIQWNDTGMHIIHVQAFTEQGCIGRPSADTVEVHPLPDATFTVSPLHGGTLCLQDSVLFKANDDNYADNYYWTPEHYFNNDDKHTIWGRVQEEQSIVTLKVTNPFGCVATWSMELDPSVCCNVPFPSAFTPNGDGLNDLFRPVAQLHEYHTYHVFRVQNRWGQTVFETTNNKAEWDGTFNGVPCDLGVYYYYLKYDCNGKTMEEKGDVTLIR